MELTRAQHRRLAREARKLASEIAEGRCPDFIAWSWCGCAAGTVVANAGLAPRGTPEHDLLAARLAYSAEAPLSAATVEEVRSHDGQLVFPLLWWADELDAASEQPPAGPSSALPAVLSDSTEEEK